MHAHGKQSDEYEILNCCVADLTANTIMDSLGRGGTVEWRHLLDVAVYDGTHALRVEEAVHGLHLFVRGCPGSCATLTPTGTLLAPALRFGPALRLGLALRLDAAAASGNLELALTTTAGGLLHRHPRLLEAAAWMYDNRATQRMMCLRF